MDILLALVFLIVIVMWQMRRTPHGPIQLKTAIALKAMNFGSQPRSIEGLRREMVMRAKGSPKPELTSIVDYAPVLNGAQLPMRLYKSNAEDTLPLVIFFHGGGWVAGSIESHDSQARQLAIESECAVLSVDYRLAPEHPYPAAYDDALATLAWVRQQHTELGVDINNIAVSGDSAGGNLAAALAIADQDTTDAPIKAQLLVYPVTDVSGFDSDSYQKFDNGFMLTRDAMKAFTLSYSAKDKAVAASPQVSPMNQPSVERVAPAMILTAGFDPLKDDGRRYADKLKDAGVSVEYAEYKESIHGFWGQPKLGSEGVRAMKESGAYLRRLLKS